MTKEPDLIDMFLKAHKRGVKKAIDLAVRTKTSLIVCVNGKVKAIRPKYKYVRVPIKPTVKNRKIPARSPRKKK